MKLQRTVEYYECFVMSKTTPISLIQEKLTL